MTSTPESTTLAVTITPVTPEVGVATPGADSVVCQGDRCLRRFAPALAACPRCGWRPPPALPPRLPTPALTRTPSLAPTCAAAADSSASAGPAAGSSSC